MNIDRPTAAAYVLWIAGGHTDVAMQPGTFVERLLGAWQVADLENHALLTSIFPELGWAVDVFKNDRQGVAILRDFAATIGADPTSDKERNP